MLNAEFEIANELGATISLTDVGDALARSCCDCADTEVFEPLLPSNENGASTLVKQHDDSTVAVPFDSCRDD